MAEKTIKQKIELTGEKQYNQAIKDAQRNLKLLQSQLKAETAEMGKNASEQDKAKAKAKSLQEQIAEQEKVVETLREALARARDEYGDNEEVLARWEMKLNSARTTLGNMRSDLDGLDGTLSGAGDALDDMGDKADQGVTAVHHLSEALGNIGDTSDGIADTMQGIFGSMVDTVKDAAMTVWNEIETLAGKANDWSDLAGFWNTSATNIQKWDRAVTASKNDFSDLTNAVTRINMGDQEKITQYTKVSKAGYEDEWEYAMAVMDSLRKMDFKTQEEALGAIFGERKAVGMKDLLNDWEAIQELTKKFDVENGGVGVTSEAMEDLAELSVQISTTKETWQAFKESLLAGATAEVALNLTGNVQGALDALISFMNAKDNAEREAALADFTRNIEEFFDRLGEAIQAAAEGMGEAGKSMQGSENNIVKALGDVLVALSDTMKWFADEGNIDMVVKGFEALVAFWATARVVGIIAKVSSFAADLAAIKAFGTGAGTLLAGGAGAGAAGAGAGAGAAGAAGGTGAAAGGWLAGKGAALAGVGGLVAIGAGFAAAANERRNNAHIRGSEQAMMDVSGDMAPDMLAYIQAQRELQELLNSPEYTDEAAEKLVDAAEEAREKLYGHEGAEALMQAYSDWLQENSYGADSWMVPEWMKDGRTVYGEETEDVDLDQDQEQRRTYSRTDAEAAIQDWWDAWRTWDKDPEGEGNEQEYLNAEAWAQEVMGDAWGDVWYKIIEELDKKPKNANLDDVPVGWYKDILDTLGTGGEKSGLTSEDISGFKSLPEQMQKAAEDGARAGISGMTLEMDKYQVGRIVAPVVSEEIGGMIVMRQ